jgi:hypothetical protein
MMLMAARKFTVPLLAFAGGAILGRIFGLRTLVRGAMTAAAVTGIAEPAMIDSHQRTNRAHRQRKVVHRGAHRRSPQKKSATVK